MSGRKSSLLGITLFLLGFTFNCGLAGSQLGGGGYFCNVICSAYQLTNGRASSLTSAKDQCKKYDRIDFCNVGSSNCKKDCGDLRFGNGEERIHRGSRWKRGYSNPTPPWIHRVEHPATVSTILPSSAHSGSAPGSTPANLRANYSTNPDPNPYSVDVQWEKIPEATLYVIEYFQFGSGKILGHEETTDTKITIARDKRSLCVQYGFRVAVANRNGIGPFGEDAVLEKPVPIYKTKPTFSLKSISFTNKEFRMNSFGEVSTDPNTVEAAVEYSLPPNWGPSDFVSVDDYVHTLMCKRPVEGSFTTHSNLSMDKPEVLIPFPGKHVQSECTYLYTLLGLKTICDTEVTFPDPSESIGGSAAALGIFINITCTSVPNAPCKTANESKQPTCAFRSFQYKVISNKSADRTASVEMSWGDGLNTRSWPILYYVVNYSLSEKPESNMVFVLPIAKNLGTVKTCPNDGGASACDGNTKKVTVDGLETGKYFVAQICAIYDRSLENTIPWDTVPRYAIDLTTTTTTDETRSSSRPTVASPPAGGSSTVPVSSTVGMTTVPSSSTRVSSEPSVISPTPTPKPTASGSGYAGGRCLASVCVALFVIRVSRWV